MTAPTHSTSPPSGILGRWNAIPLYFRILLAMAIGVVVAMMLGERAAFLEIPSTIILQLLGALAPPLILVAVVHVLMTSEITGKTAARLAGLLLLNTLVAIIIGLTVANVMQPGKSANIPPPPEEVHEKASGPFAILWIVFPRALLVRWEIKPTSFIFIALAFGIAF